MDIAKQDLTMLLKSHLDESLEVMRAFVEDRASHRTLIAFADVITRSMTNKGKLLLAGNGGSAADAQHIAGEFLSRLFFDRAPLPAIALTTDTSVLTAVGNDYGYERVFERQVLGLGQPGDVLLVISTSGKSSNIIRALEAARSMKIVTLGFTGAGEGPMNALCDQIFAAPASKTALIQQVHIAAAHVICGVVEQQMFGKLHQQAS